MIFEIVSKGFWGSHHFSTSYNTHSYDFRYSRRFRNVDQMIFVPGAKIILEIIESISKVTKSPS